MGKRKETIEEVQQIEIASSSTNSESAIHRKYDIAGQRIKVLPPLRRECFDRMMARNHTSFEM